VFVAGNSILVTTLYKTNDSIISGVNQRRPPMLVSMGGHLTINRVAGLKILRN
jgi:hypothetical protein